MKKIMICGPSGTGKTTLAKALSEHFEIPFVTTSASTLYEKYGFKNHQDVIREGNLNPSLGLKFQYDLLNHRIETLNSHDQFISDRSPIDNIVYTLFQNSFALSEIETKLYIEEALSSLNKSCTHLIYLPYHFNIELEVDNQRITNSYFQWLIGSIFDLVIQRYISVSNPHFRYIKTYERNFEHKLVGLITFLNT